MTNACVQHFTCGTLVKSVLSSGPNAKGKRQTQCQALPSFTKLYQALPVVVAVLIIGGILTWFGGVRNLLAYARGDGSVVLLVAPSDERPLSIKVSNLTFGELSVLSCTTSCNCIGVHGLPAELASGGSVHLPVEGNVDDGIIVRVSILLQDTDGIREKRLEISNADFLGDS